VTSATQQFTATVTGSATQSVTWSIDGAGSGNATVGTIDATGLYTAPAVPPAPNSVTIRATSAVDATRSGTAIETVNNPLPVLNSITPTQLDAGTGITTLTVNGSGFNPQSVIRLNGTALTTNFISSTQLTASLSAAELSTAGDFPVTVATPAPGGGTSSASNLAIKVVVQVLPSSTTVVTGDTQAFTATVTGSADQTVTWSIDGAGSGNATVGTIDPAGTYTAPAVPPAANTITIRATSAVDNTRSGAGTATVNNPVPVLTSITPTQTDAGSADTTITVNGSGFNPQSVVTLDGSALATAFLDTTHLTAIIPSAQLSTAGDKTVTVFAPTPGGGTSVGATFSVVFVISISPSTTSTITTQTQQFTATVKGSADQTVTWSIDGHGSGDSTVGTIDSAGLYTAPAIVPASPGITIRATSNADATKTATAALTIASILEDWPKYRRDLSNTGRSAETILYSGNVKDLKKKWTFTADSFGGTARISASPAVATVGGIRTVYIGAWSGFFYAIDADTGIQRWRFEVPRNTSTTATHCTTSSRCRIASSPAVENGIVYFGAEDAYLYALDAATGTLIWRQQLGDPENGAEIWSSPSVANGIVYIGLASHNSAPCVAGKIAAFKAADGTPVWNFDAVDQTSCSSGTCLGAGIWSSPAIDEQFGTLWIGTGNAGAGCVPSTAQATRYPDGILAIDSTTGSLKGFYQTLPNDTTDSGDIGASPALHSTQVVDQCTPGNSIQQYWVSVPSKDNKFWTAPRDATGFVANPVSIALDGSQGIASPAAEPFVDVVSCAPGKTITTTGNHLYVPTSGGNMFNFRQDATPSPDTPAFDWETQIQSCGGNNCPLFSAPASVNDLIFFGGGDGNFYAMLQDGTFIDPSTSTKIFSFGTLGLVTSGPAISHGQVIFGSADGKVYCLSLNGQ
jgi:outer membrane protein assembly factor BamB